MTPIILESPYAGDVELHVAYARACMLDCLERGEAPFASHLLYTQVLDDTNAFERAAGIGAGFAWRALATKTVVYVDLGTSPGMQKGIAHAVHSGHDVEERKLGPEAIAEIKRKLGRVV